MVIEMTKSFIQPLLVFQLTWFTSSLTDFLIISFEICFRTEPLPLTTVSSSSMTNLFLTRLTVDDMDVGVRFLDLVDEGDGVIAKSCLLVVLPPGDDP